MHFFWDLRSGVRKMYGDFWDLERLAWALAVRESIGDPVVLVASDPPEDNRYVQIFEIIERCLQNLEPTLENQFGYPTKDFFEAKAAVLKEHFLSEPLKFRAVTNYRCGAVLPDAMAIRKLCGLKNRFIYYTDYREKLSPTEEIILQLEENLKPGYHKKPLLISEWLPACRQIPESEVLRLYPEKGEQINKVCRTPDKVFNRFVMPRYQYGDEGMQYPEWRDWETF